MSDETDLQDELAPPPTVYRTAYDLETGALLWVSYGVEGMVLFPDIPGHGWIDGEWHAATHYVLDGQATPRPATGLPGAGTIAAGADWPIADVPPGTLVLVDDATVGTVDESGLVLSFALAGVWRVSLRPPFPWLDADAEVTVT
jgi:hypothetical protein